MDIGLSSANFYPEVNTEDSIGIMKSLGFNFGEIFINTPSEYSEEFLYKLNGEKEEQDFEILSLHAFCATFEFYLFDSYERRRKDMMEYFKRHCEFARRIGAKYYTFHGMKSTALNSKKLKLIGEVYEELSYIALENNIKLAQENVAWCQSGDLEFLKFLKEEIKNPVYFTLDIKQAYKANLSPYKYLKVMGDRLVNIHINDKDKNNTCLLPGTGEVDFKLFLDRLKKMGYNGRAIIEVYRENFSSYEELLKAKEYLEHI